MACACLGCRAARAVAVVCRVCCVCVGLCVPGVALTSRALVFQCPALPPLAKCAGKAGAASMQGVRDQREEDGGEREGGEGEERGGGE